MDSRGNDAAVGFLVGKKDEEGECVTYKAPREKIPIIWTFLLVLKRKDLIIGIGRQTVMRSIPMLDPDKA
jgi:hypothetical protein